MTHSPKYPLKHLTIIIRLLHRVKCELALRIIVLFQIKQYRSAFEDDKVVALAVDEDGNSPVRIQLDEPRLFLNVFEDVYFLDASK